MTIDTAVLRDRKADVVLSTKVDRRLHHLGKLHLRQLPRTLDCQRSICAELEPTLSAAPILASYHMVAVSGAELKSVRDEQRKRYEPGTDGNHAAIPGRFLSKQCKTGACDK